MNTRQKCLGDLPNHEGFECIGITHDDNEIQCVVKKDSVGFHRIYSNDVSVYHKLNSWRAT
jgi:hypothetical protein